MTKLTLGQLEAFLLQACNLLREGGSESTDFKYYIFGMLFLKSPATNPTAPSSPAYILNA